MPKGEDGILRHIQIDSEGSCVRVSTDDGTGDYAVEELEKIVMLG